MSKLSDLIEAEAQAAESDSGTDAPMPDDVKVTRGHGRSKVLQIRLNDDEYRLVEKMAADRMIPASTFARIALLRAIST